MIIQLYCRPQAILSLLLFTLGIAPFAQAQNTGVGIGTTTPLARLHVADSAVLFSAAGDVPGTPGLPPISGQGRRMMWYPDKAAFRAGYTSSTDWDYNNIGLYSFAAGYGAIAKGEGSAVLGYGYASGLYSLAAVGGAAYGTFSVALGLKTTTQTYSSSASAYLPMAGTFVFGDNSNTYGIYLAPTAINQMSMRFANGYRLFTDAFYTTGVTLAPGGGSWTSLSDRRKKEHFRTLNAESLLQKVAALPVSEWNYKSQDSIVRHIGPMAQDFYAAFGLDGVGADTTINTGDIDGVNMAAIQALEARTASLRREADEQATRADILQDENAALRAQVATLQQQQNGQAAATAALLRRLQALEDRQTPLVSGSSTPQTASLR